MMRMSRIPGGTWARLLGGMTNVSLNSVVSQRWNVLFARAAIKISHRRMRARSTWVPPRCLRTMGLLPHTLSTIFGVRAFDLSMKSEKRARIRGILGLKEILLFNSHIVLYVLAYECSIWCLQFKCVKNYNKCKLHNQSSLVHEDVAFVFRTA